MSERATSTGRAAWRAPLSLATVFLVLVGPVVQEYSGPTAPRYTLAAALYEHQTVALDRYSDNVFIDRLELRGHLYSDKAPGQPFFSVPAYALARALGAEPATVVHARGNLGAWAVTLWSSALPGVALLLLIYASARRLGERAAIAGTAATCFGTLLLPYAAQLYGHLLAAALAFGAWLLARHLPLTATRTFVAGLLGGAAVATEYQTAIIVVVVAVWIGRRNPRRLGWFVLGGLPSAVGLAAYQWAVLGSPFSSSYSRKPAHEEATPLVTGLPKPLQALEILVGSRGVLIFTPIVAVGVWGLVVLVRRRASARPEAMASLVVLGAFFLLQAGWPNPWGGEMPGPRYLIPALPFLGLGLAAAWRLRPRLVAGFGGWSAFAMLWPLYSRHFVPDGGWLVDSQLSYIHVHGAMPTLFTMALGTLGWVVHAALLVLALRWLDHEVRALPPTRPGLPVEMERASSSIAS